MAFYDFAKHRKTVSYTTFLGFQKKWNKIPYETCRLLRLGKPFSQKGPKNYQKSIGFFTKTRMGFRPIVEPYKTNRKSMILWSRFPLLEHPALAGPLSGCLLAKTALPPGSKTAFTFFCTANFFLHR